MLRQFLTEVLEQLALILKELRKLNTTAADTEVTAAMAQSDLDNLTANANQLLPLTISTLEALQEANASGNQLDPNKVEADVNAIKAGFASLATMLPSNANGVSTTTPVPGLANTTAGTKDADGHVTGGASAGATKT